jgi:hypothetical protein
MIAEPDHPPDDENRRSTPRLFAHALEQFHQRAGHRLLTGQRAVVDDDASIVAGPAIGLHGVEHARQLLRAGVADDRASSLARLAQSMSGGVRLSSS